MSQRQARVIVAYATVKMLDGVGKPAVHGFYRDAVLPAGADPAAVEGLVRRGYAQWVDADPPAAADKPADEPTDTKAEPKPDDKPAEEKAAADDKATEDKPTSRAAKAAAKAAE